MAGSRVLRNIYFWLDPCLRVNLYIGLHSCQHHFEVCLRFMMLYFLEKLAVGVATAGSSYKPYVHIYIYVYTWTSKLAKIMDPVLPILSILGYRAIILGSFGGPGIDTYTHTHTYSVHRPPPSPLPLSRLSIYPPTELPISHYLSLNHGVYYSQPPYMHSYRFPKKT